MSVTYPLGFRAGGIQAGLRTTPGPVSYTHLTLPTKA